MKPPFDPAAILALERPHRDLLTYYVLVCLAFPPAFPFVILPAYFRYHTMRYRFTDEGISMSWGILFRREIIINYARIQDIHLTSNVVERWLGLARIQVQTASGSSKAEMTIEGLQFFEPLRDFLYARMRGSRPALRTPPPREPSQAASPEAATLEELTATLREVASEVRALREAMQSSRKGGARAD